MHDQYEALCALAATGDISTADWRTLKRHLEDCAFCSGEFVRLREMHPSFLEPESGLEVVRGREAEGTLRAKILRRTVDEGARFSVEANSEAAPRLITEAPEPYETPRVKLQGSYHNIQVWAAVAVLVVAAAAGLIKFRSQGWEARLFHRPTQETHSLPPSTTRVPDSTATPAPAMQTPDRPGAFESALKASELDRARLERELTELRRRSSVMEHTNTEVTGHVKDLEQRLEIAHTTIEKTRAELQSAKSMAAAGEPLLIATQQENRELSAKLNEQTASLEREKDLLSAGREIRDLVAARNLHIIDVYDTDARGKTKKAFGRVFYTEGKSLVFYAYDLSTHRANSGKYAYYAWGRRDGADETVRNLGIFYTDDQTQTRWILKFSDPKVLSEIDSVFVTLEPTDKPLFQPRGKKLMSAYLGMPANHP
jgi:hypothetical protein